MSNDPVHQLKIERKGGLAGFGLPNSRLRSRGAIDLQSLSASDRQAIEKLFAGGAPSPAPASQADAFQYHLTMTTPQGEKTIVVPERQVPEAIRDAVHDELD